MQSLRQFSHITTKYFSACILGTQTFLYNHSSAIKISKFNTDADLFSIPRFIGCPYTDFTALPPRPNPVSRGTHVALYLEVVSVLL